MSRPPKREKPGLAATGNLSKKQSGGQHKTGARGVKHVLRVEKAVAVLRVYERGDAIDCRLRVRGQTSPAAWACIKIWGHNITKQFDGDGRALILNVSSADRSFTVVSFDPLEGGRSGWN